MSSVWGGDERERSADQASLRISDADRDRIATALSQHAAEGRLTIDELEERLEIAYAALTREQARAALAGLPAIAPPHNHHHLHLGPRRDDAPVLPEWLHADETTPRPLPSQGATPAVSPPDPGGSVPSDEAMQAAYDAWRQAASKAKAARKASQRVKASGDKQAAFRALSESVRLTAAERSRRAKLNELRKRRPDWTGNPRHPR
jgi:Domain of unknown function (DUF1707)